MTFSLLANLSIEQDPRMGSWLYERIEMRKLISRGIAAVGLAVALTGALALVGCGGSTANQEDEGVLSGTVSTNGSTSMEKVIGSLAEAFMAENQEVAITYDATGSGTGIECALQGSADIGLASRDLKEDESDLQAVTIALDGIAIVVNENCGISDLSMEQLKDIFTGKIKNWSEVGGSDMEIACIGRENGSGTRDGFESVTDTKDACVLSQELTSTGAVLTAVANSENAIGYASLSTVEGAPGIKAITVEGVTCSEQTILDGTYKVQRPFNMVLKEGAELSPQAQAFVDFAVSEQAAELIREAGAVPLV